MYKHVNRHQSLFFHVSFGLRLASFRGVLLPFVTLRGCFAVVRAVIEQGVVRSFHQWRAELQWGNKKRHLGFFERRES